MSDYRQQQEQDEESLFLLEKLQILRQQGIPEEDLQFIARTAGLDSAEYPRILINEK